MKMLTADKSVTINLKSLRKCKEGNKEKRKKTDTK